MYGIIIWLSARAQSALIVTDGGTTLAFGRCNSQTDINLAVGDLVFVPGLCADQDEFTAGLTLVIPAFWPEIDQSINTHAAQVTCRLLKKSGNFAQGYASIAADNFATAPDQHRSTIALTAIK